MSVYQYRIKNVLDITHYNSYNEYFVIEAGLNSFIKTSVQVVLYKSHVNKMFY